LPRERELREGVLQELCHRTSKCLHAMKSWLYAAFLLDHGPSV